MTDMLIALLILIGLAILTYGVALVRAAIAKRMIPGIEAMALGAVVNFFDTLGIGSFATTTAVFKLRNMIPVKEIPGTLNVGHTLSTIVQAYIYTRLIPVDSTTLILMIAVGYLFGRSFINPILLLKRATHGVASGQQRPCDRRAQEARCTRD